MPQHPCDVSRVRLVQVRLIFRLQRATTEPPADDATARSAITFVPLRARLVEVLDDSNFDQTLAEHEAVLVFFHATWCGHCRDFTPKFEAAA